MYAWQNLQNTRDCVLKNKEKSLCIKIKNFAKNFLAKFLSEFFQNSDCKGSKF